MTRVPHDVCVQLFQLAPDGPRYLMLKRTPPRGGFWQPVTGAPLPYESDADAAIREVHEETGYDISTSLIALEFILLRPAT